MFKSHRRFVVFRMLTPVLARFAPLFSKCGFSVIYFDLAGSLRQPKTVADLACRGVHQIDYSKLPDYDAYSFLKVTSDLADRIMARVFPNDVLTKVSELFPPVADRNRKVRAVIREVVVGQIVPDVYLYALAKYIRGRGHYCFAWPPGRLRAFPVLAEAMTWPEFFLALVVVGISGVTKLFTKRVRELNVEVLSQSPPHVDVSSAQVLMFPHKGPSYGNLFKKDQYYSFNEKSQFNRENILHVELGDELSVSQRDKILADYRVSDLAPFILNVPVVGGGAARWWRAFLFGRRNGLTLRASFLAEAARGRVIRGQRALSCFLSARVVLLGYEFLFPVWLAYAFNARGILTAAAQERLMLSYVPGWTAIIDHYFVHGDKVRSVLAENTNACITNVHVVGDVRTPDFTSFAKRNHAFPEGFGHLTLVFDWHTEPDPFIEAQATTNNIPNNLLFYKDVLRLAREFPNSFFLLRGKDAEWFELDAFADICDEIDKLPNISVSTDYSRPLISYELAAACDSIIARYTSIGDQCLASGKPVIYHDGTVNKGRLVASILDFKPYDVFVRNYDDLASRYAHLLETGRFMSKQSSDQMISDYFCAPQSPGTARAAMLSALEAMLEKSKDSPTMTDLPT